MRPGGAHCVEQPSTGGSPNTNARGAETSRPTVLGSAGPASPSKVARPDQLTPAIAFRQGACLAGASLGAEIVGPAFRTLYPPLKPGGGSWPWLITTASLESSIGPSRMKIVPSSSS